MGPLLGALATLILRAVAGMGDGAQLGGLRLWERAAKVYSAEPEPAEELLSLGRDRLVDQSRWGPDEGGADRHYPCGSNSLASGPPRLLQGELQGRFTRPTVTAWVSDVGGTIASATVIAGPGSSWRC